MSKFVIHKRGFFYTDESFELAEGAKGSIAGTFDNLDSAKLEKEKQDIFSMERFKGMNAVDFFFHSSTYDQVYQKLEEYYKTEFGLTISDKYYFDLPKDINPEQAKVFLNILDISFHDIVEYSDDEELNSEDFNLVEQELGEF